MDKHQDYREQYTTKLISTLKNIDKNNFYCNILIIENGSSVPIEELKKMRGLNTKPIENCINCIKDAIKKGGNVYINITLEDLRRAAPFRHSYAMYATQGKIYFFDSNANGMDYFFKEFGQHIYVFFDKLKKEFGKDNIIDVSKSLNTKEGHCETMSLYFLTLICCYGIDRTKNIINNQKKEDRKFCEFFSNFIKGNITQVADICKNLKKIDLLKKK